MKDVELKCCNSKQGWITKKCMKNLKYTALKNIKEKTCICKYIYIYIYIYYLRNLSRNTISIS
jgi:hypothetical protein